MRLARCNRNASNFSEDKHVSRTSAELGKLRHTAESITEDNSLQKWADIFDGEGLIPDLTVQSPEPTESVPLQDSLHKLVEIPEPPNTRTRVVGNPISLETAQGLRNILLGNASYSFTRDWKTLRFQFRDYRSSIPYGLQANSPGARALTLCVQAYVLKHLLFGNVEEEDKPFGRMPPTPTQFEQEYALIQAFTDILWKVSLPLTMNNKIVQDKRKVVIVLPGDLVCFSTPGFFLSDGVTEKLWLFALYTKQDVQTFIKRNMHFFCGRNHPGGMLLIYSVVLTHSIEATKADLAQCQGSLLTESARPTQAFINLFLTGNATCYIHNGVICYDKHGQLLATPKPGPRQRSEIGFLFYNKAESDEHRTMVGCMLRTPLLPIWMTQVNGSYGMLFCTSQGLVADWKTERLFTIHYYTGHFSQTNETNITIDTRRRAFVDPDREISIWDDEEEKERKQPSLELLLDTKWPEASHDWNGETPFY